MLSSDNSQQMAASTSNSQQTQQSTNNSQGDAQNRKKIGTFKAAVIVAGQMLGIGVLALPKAVADTSVLPWSGLMLIFVFGLVSMYTASLLGECLESLPDDFWVKHELDPYPGLAEYSVSPGKIGCCAKCVTRAHATGRNSITEPERENSESVCIKVITEGLPRFVSYVVRVAMDMSLFGVLVVFMLLASQNIQTLFEHVDVHVSFCYWIMVVTAFLILPSWLESPKDFWPIAVGALSATAVACVLVIVQTLLQLGKGSPTFEHEIDFLTFFGSFGAIAFAFGGHSTFPTIQHDMEDREEFPQSCIIAFSVVLVLYLPVAASGYSVFGIDVRSNVLQSLPHGPVTTTVIILVTVHLLCTFVIAMNPLSRDLQKILLKRKGSQENQQQGQQAPTSRSGCNNGANAEHGHTGRASNSVNTADDNGSQHIPQQMRERCRKWWKAVYDKASGFPWKRRVMHTVIIMVANWKRHVLRTVIILVALFVAESIPSFGAVLNLVGGTTTTLLVFVFPPLFHICLCDKGMIRKCTKCRSTMPKWDYHGRCLNCREHSREVCDEQRQRCTECRNASEDQWDIYAIQLMAWLSDRVSCVMKLALKVKPALNVMKYALNVMKPPLNVIIMLVGVTSGVAATVAAIREIASPDTFVPPCYMNITAASGK